MWVATGRLITLAAFWNGSLAKTTLRTIEKPIAGKWLNGTK
jgi:hypothetical protein